MIHPHLSQLLYVECEEPPSAHNASLLRSSLTPTKKVDVDRTIMPDGTIVTTVTTVQSRLKVERSPGTGGEGAARCDGVGAVLRSWVATGMSLLDEHVAG